jgi:hypothetical protein
MILATPLDWADVDSSDLLLLFAVVAAAMVGFLLARQLREARYGDEPAAATCPASWPSATRAPS